MFFVLSLFFLFGTLFGSFFNVLIFRLPRKESIVSPPSSCPHCAHQIRWYENIPIVSYLILRGRCGGCRSKISVQYPVIELTTGLFSLAVGAQFLQKQELSLFWWELVPLVAQYLTLILLIPAALIDFRHRIIPNSLTVGGLVVGIAAAFIPGGVTPFDMVLGILAGGGVLLLLGLGGTLLLKRSALGMGDVKLMAWFGALFGWKVALGTIFLGAIFGIVFAMFYDILFRQKRIPFAPALSVALVTMIFWGEDLWNRYMTLF